MTTGSGSNGGQRAWSRVTQHAPQCPRSGETTRVLAGTRSMELYGCALPLWIEALSDSVLPLQGTVASDMGLSYDSAS